MWDFQKSFSKGTLCPAPHLLPHDNQNFTLGQEVILSLPISMVNRKTERVGPLMLAETPAP